MPNPIGWCDLTINPISGCSNCDGDGLCQGRFKCYAEGFARRLSGIEAKFPGRTGYPPIPHHFAPCWHQNAFEKITKLRGGGKRIFLDSMSDWFCGAIPVDWLQEVLIAVEKKPAHHFLVLTKRPENIERILQKCTAQIPENLWMGVSVCSEDDLWRIWSLNLALPSRVHKFVSLEPLLGPVADIGDAVEWVLIGALTGRSDSMLPDKDWVENAIRNMAAHEIPVFMKDSLAPLYHHDPWNLLRQFPEAMV